MEPTSQINISCSDHFLEEKKYVFDILFKGLLEVDYTLSLHEKSSYLISHGSQTIEIADIFFQSLSTNEDYYNHEKYIPKSIEYLNVNDSNINALPVLFGNDDFNNKDGNVFIGADIIASIFFMITRWEEIAIKERDTYNRFPEEQSLAIKFDFNKRPIVNEYADFIGKCLTEIGVDFEIKRKYKLFITHDIDDFSRYDSYIKFIKAIAGDIIKRKSISAFWTTISDFYGIKFKKNLDVYDTFDFLMEQSERIGEESRFYFIAGKLGEEDVRFNIDRSDVVETIKKIRSKGHIVGIHPGFETLDNLEQLITELNRLKLYDDEISEGRQHYLRMRIPDTWNQWVDSGLAIDSSIGYYSTIGFRAGICNEYETFDVCRRCTTGLIERPLVVMDTALRRITNSKDDILETVVLINDQVRKFKGDFVLLWHNSNLTRNEWRNWDKTYIEILNIVKVDK